MKYWLGLLSACLLGGCITPALDNLSGNSSSNNLSSGGSDQDKIGNSDDKKKHGHDRDTSEMNCSWESLPANPLHVFTADGCAVFLADYNNNLTDRVSENDGTATGTLFTQSLFGSGLHQDPASTEKTIYRFPATAPLDLTTGSMEALVYAESVPSGFMHIIDKSWQYGITAFDGLLAVHFGGGWWFSNIALPVNAWSYVGATYDGTTLRLYLNGELAASTAYHGFQGYNYYELGIANASDNGFDIPFFGTIDEVRISKCVRTDSEIAQIGAVINPPVIHPVRNVSGCWNVTQYNGHNGMLHLIQTGTVLSGNMDWYTFSDSPVVGSISGDSVFYDLVYPDLAPLIGYYRATLDATGNNLVNGFTESNNGHSAAWVATKTACPVGL